MSSPDVAGNPINADLLAVMLDAAIEAAALIDAVYARPISAEAKADGSPVTEADRLAETAILAHLETTGIPVLAEESVSQGRIPQLGRRFFVVDPLDGTKEFLKRNGEFTVNIALVEDGRPVLGVVLAPATGDVYSGGPDGALHYRLSEGQLGPSRAITVTSGGSVRVVASRSHGDDMLGTLFLALGITDSASVGSSLKFCLLAQGDAELYPRFKPTCEWDTAAGQAVLEAAGGVVLGPDGEPLRYGGQTPGFLNPAFVAARDTDLARRALAEMRAMT